MYYHKFRIVTTGIFVFCLMQLSGCSFFGSKHSKDIDGPPDIDIDVTKVSDATPKKEPYHPYGTKNYTVGGRHYKVLKNARGYVKTGYASWYGSKFHGNHTSTQERYNLYGMTAASTELPLPSYVQVTNLRNGKQVVVRVNDRGPFHPKRILDLSYAAAKKLDFVDRGIAPVKVVAIDPETWGKYHKITPLTKQPKSVVPQSNDNKTNNMYLQVGAFSDFNNAKQLTAEIAKFTNKPTTINHNANLYKVQVGPIACATQSEQLKQFLEEKGFSKIVVIAN